MTGKRQLREQQVAPDAAADALRSSAELRRRAEELLDGLSAAAASASPAPEELAAAVHELRVHQIELEMQNEELRRAQLELSAPREKYFELFNLAPVGYLTVTDKGIGGDANITAAHLFGMERQLLLGQPLSAFVFAADRDAYYLHQRALQKAEAPQSLELRLQRVVARAGGAAAPAPFWAHLESVPQRAADGEPPTFWVTFSDITARKQAEAEIQRLNADLEKRVVTRTAELAAVTAELEAFAYSTSHDLRAPLRAIDGFSLMVMEDAAAVLSPEDVHHLERVRAAAQRMGRLIDDLLGLSRLARRALIRERVDVSALAREVADELLAEHEARAIEVVIAAHMTADSDPLLLRVILRNLLDNAWKFTARHATARVEVGVTEADGEPAFFVRDDGAGFDPNYAQHLFGAFQRMHSTREFEGDGIGLAMVQRLVHRHGGRAWAESQVEQGATFFFTLPSESQLMPGPGQPRQT